MAPSVGYVSPGSREQRRVKRTPTPDKRYVSACAGTLAREVYELAIALRSTLTVLVRTADMTVPVVGVGYHCEDTCPQE